MPITDTNTKIHDYPLSKFGVNLSKNFLDLFPEECLFSQNAVWKNGMVKRNGQSLVSSNQVVANKKIFGLHKFYKNDGTGQVLAACDTTVKYLSGGTWSNAVTGLTTGLDTNMCTWGALNKAYICNGTDTMKSWDGTTAVSIPLIDGIPLQALPYQDRLLTIINTSLGGLLTWSESFTDITRLVSFTVTIASPAVFTSTNHGLEVDDAVMFATDGALPTGLTPGTTYYVISTGLTANAFEVSTSIGGAAVNTSGTQSGNHTFSQVNGNWELKSECGVKPDTYLYGMCYHASNDSVAGMNTKILLAGANGMYLFHGSDLRTPFTTGNYTIFPLAIQVGCNAPKTMCWTPKGTIWLGIDRQVYLLPFDSATPIPIGGKIQSTGDTEGIEKIPVAKIKDACAVYHDGYYILSITNQNGSNNTTQWWLDIKRLAKDDNEQVGPWYGPMKGQSISCFAVQNGPGDGGELLGGESQSYGYVYFCNSPGVYSDITSSTGGTKSINVKWETFYNPLDNPSLMKDIHKMEFELLDVLGTVTLNMYDIVGLLSTGATINMSGSDIYWNDYYWDEQYWSSSSPARIQTDISPAIRCRRLSLLIEHDSNSDTFELYAVRVSAVEQGQIFEA
jgi:hypothetical protein